LKLEEVIRKKIKNPKNKNETPSYVNHCAFSFFLVLSPASFKMKKNKIENTKQTKPRNANISGTIIIGIAP